MKKLIAGLLTAFLILITCQNVFAQERNHRGYSLGFEALSPIEEGISILKFEFFSVRLWDDYFSSARNFSISMYRVIDDYGDNSYVPVYNFDEYIRMRITKIGVLDFFLQSGITYNSFGSFIVGTAFMSIGSYVRLQITPNFNIYSDLKIPFLWGISIFGKGNFKFMDDFLFSQKIGFKYDFSPRFAVGLDLEMSNMSMIGVASKGEIFTFGTNLGLSHYF